MSWIFKPGEEPIKGRVDPNISYPLGTWLYTNNGNWGVWGSFPDKTPDWWLNRRPEEVPQDIRTTLLLLGG